MSTDLTEKPAFDAEKGLPRSEKDVDNIIVTPQQGPTELKTSEDGHILYPQPSDDPNDPLNWSWGKKHLILFVISATSFLPDYGSATGAVTLIPQSVEWRMSEDEVNHSTVGNLFMIGAGGIFTVAFAAYFGRLPVFFWFTVIAFATAAWCAGAGSFESFMTARILNGFFSTVAQGWPFWILTILTGLCMFTIAFFVDETYYDRRLPMEKQPPRRSRVLRVIGIEQWRSRHLRNTFWEAMMRPVQVILKPTVFISFVYFFFTFAWVVGINTTLAIFIGPLYDFGLKQIGTSKLRSSPSGDKAMLITKLSTGYLYFAPVVAAILGEACGIYLHDSVVSLHARRLHNNTFHPEARLLVIYLATPFTVSGLVLIGFCLQYGYHYMLTALAWGLYVFGIMITTVGLTAYNLEAYPEASGETAAWISASRVLGGFIISYFQVRWAEAMGPRGSFGVQAGLSAGVVGLVVVLSVYGGRLREWSGSLKFRTD
ncbi:MAG: hypothetical protein LQ350_002120 [Teloschistes chrysophthalmus]|nr:MAG: hypothetical protein LQ350_002120 [Niorma chrysophthalma]